MRELLLTQGAGPLRVLAIGAHCDDIEIGAGATLSKLAARSGGCEISCVVLTSTPQREAESRACLARLGGPAAVSLEAHRLPDSRLPAHLDAVKDILGRWASTDWDLVFSHHRWDAHQDHRILGELVPTAFRDHLIAQFEIPKWDGDLGASRPNTYVGLTTEDLALKWAALDECHVSQRHHDWWTAETFSALGRLRGMECRAPYAEAFRVDKMRWSPQF